MSPEKSLSGFVRTVAIGVRGYALRLDHGRGACIIVRSTLRGIDEVPGGTFLFAEHGRSAAIGIATELAASLDSTAAYEEAAEAGLIRIEPTKGSPRA